ncbi:MAG: hypothetical protein MRJ67_11280 [Nitrospirales bacterium]|nr:hypothetical protein [Nitrospirales bacterium]
MLLLAALARLFMEHKLLLTIVGRKENSPFLVCLALIVILDVQHTHSDLTDWSVVTEASDR